MRTPGLALPPDLMDPDGLFRRPSFVARPPPVRRILYLLRGGLPGGYLETVTIILPKSRVPRADSECKIDYIEVDITAKAPRGKVGQAFSLRNGISAHTNSHALPRPEYCFSSTTYCDSRGIPFAETSQSDIALNMMELEASVFA